MEDRVRKYGKDIFKQNSLGGEIGKLTQGRAQFYFNTGEFGGAGGSGGGVLGVLGGGGIRCLLELSSEGEAHTKRNSAQKELSKQIKQQRRTARANKEKELT